jgi:formate-dependent nitrite reductase membrane component NrfD
MAAGRGSGDGRHIDPSVGLLAGEGAQQRVGGEPPDALQAYDVYRRQPGRPERGDDPTYYDRPVLKEPVWIWSVPAYFYVGGAAGASAVLGEVAETFAGRHTEGLVTRCRWIGAAGGAVGTALLVHDLGRPERFLNMLRVFRPTSPMSVGSWVLAAATPCFAASAALPHVGGALGAFGNAVGKLAGLLGLPLAAYTGVLLANTAVPLWQTTRRELPVLFMASAAASAASLLELGDLNSTEQNIVNRFGAVAMAVELAAGVALERRAAALVERVGRPLKHGLAGSLWKASTALTAGCLVMSLLPGRSRPKRIVEGAAGTAAGLALRLAIFHAGKASARDPRATFQLQRAQQAAATPA